MTPPSVADNEVERVMDKLPQPPLQRPVMMKLGLIALIAFVALALTGIVTSNDGPRDTRDVYASARP